MYSLNKVGEKTYYIDCPTNIGLYKLNDTDVCIIAVMIKKQGEK